MTVIFEMKSEGCKEVLYVQDDGTLALVNVIDAPAEIAGEYGSVLSAEDAAKYFPEYADRIAAALEGRR
jgi:hypothetical protein